MMNDHDIRDDSDDSAVVAASKGRRRLIGAGVSATPFLLTLVSQPALGVTCFTPSRSLSKNTSVSQAGKDAECIGAKSPAYYKDATAWPIPKTTLMHPTFRQGNSPGVTRFLASDGITSLTIQQALEVSTTMVHSYLIAAYLNKKTGGIIPHKILSESDILGMWGEYASLGYYEPFAGTQWHETEIIGYLKNNGIVV